MRTKLEALAAYLAGHEEDDAERLRGELDDPASESSQFLAATQALSRDVFGEHVLKWLGLPSGPSREGADIAQKPSHSAARAVVRALPWIISIAACILAGFLWLDCRKHRHDLEAALAAALAKPKGSEAALARIDDNPKRLKTANAEPQPPGAGDPTPTLPASSEPKHDTVTDKKGGTSKEPNIPTGPVKDGEGPAPQVTPKTPAPQKVPMTEGGQPRVDSKKPGQVEVPQVGGLSYAEAKQCLEAAGLVLRPTEDPNGGLVKSQTPTAGAAIKRGDAVVAILGPKTPPPDLLAPKTPPPVLRAQVPDVCGVIGADKARVLLKQAGLGFAAYSIVDGKRILIAPDNYIQLAKSKVAQQAPPPGASVPAGTMVECSFEAPKKSRPAQLTVPNVIGKTQADAQRTISEAGLVMKALNNPPNGRAVTQNPPPGMSAKPGDCVTVDFAMKKPSGK